jgi:hypothetical protein
MLPEGIVRPRVAPLDERGDVVRVEVRRLRHQRAFR